MINRYPEDCSLPIAVTVTITSILALLYYYPIKLSTQDSSSKLGSANDTLTLDQPNMWRDVEDQMSAEDQGVVLDFKENGIDSFEESLRERDALYDIIIPLASPHGVPSLPKTLDSAIIFLKLAQLVDKRLQNNPKIDSFFEHLATMEQDAVRISKQGFSNIKVLVVEGLLSSGKSTLINGLKAVTQATVVEGIPGDLLEIKYLFNAANVPEAVMSALDHVINYCIAHKIIAESHSQPPGTALLTYQHFSCYLICILLTSSCCSKHIKKSTEKPYYLR
jgi:hypothetical protein